MKDWIKTIKIDHFIAVISLFLIFGFLFYVATKHYDKDKEALIYGIVGALTASLNQLYQFFFGTSKSSQKKDEMIHKQMESNINNKTENS